MHRDRIMMPSKRIDEGVTRHVLDVVSMEGGVLFSRSSSALRPMTMKKSTLLNADIAYLVATLGHTDEITIADAGLPIPDHVQRIDLALTHGVPSFLDTVRVILTESQIEGVVMAEEFAKVSPELYQALLELLAVEQQRCGKTFSIQTVSHEEFKVRTQSSKAVVRTGECTPYANVIFQAGVVF